MSSGSSDERPIIRSPIISCSRRTDIPAFLMDWVIKAVKIGYVDVTNPINRTQVSRISLKPEDVKCWVWWSKNFSEWIRIYENNTNLFNSFKGHTFQFTINSPSELEKNISISLEERFKQLKWLINEFGLLSINYRFDPVTFYKKHDSSKIFNNLDKFEYIISNVSSLGLKEMIFSFATIYSKVKTRMISRGFIPIDPPFEKKREILNNVIEICDKYDINLKACCQPDLLEIEGIEQAHCIDAYKIEKIIGET